MIGSGENFTLTKDNMPKLKEELQKAVRQVTNFDKLKNQIEMTMTSEGLRIELLESSSGTFFESGKPGLNDDGRELLVALAEQLGKLPNHISIEGHTDAKPYAWNRDYGTGNYPPTAPMPPADSCRPPDCAPTRFRR